ncbi:MAG: calcium-binding protein [Arenibacterium sp.]
MTPTLTDLSGLEAWTQFGQGLLAYTADPELIDSFDWSSINSLTVAEYLDLLDDAEALLANFDWSFLASQVPLITSILQQQGLPQSVIDQAVSALNQLASGDVSFLTDGFDFARETLNAYDPSTVIFDAVSGNVTPPVDGPTTGDDFLVGTSGDDKIKALAGDDLINGKGGDDILIGDGGDDVINGGNGKDRLLGRAGGDDLKGGKGKDKLSGGGGNDDLGGGKGNDTLIAGKGVDTLTGNGGNDRFVFTKKDGDNIVTDFQIGKDKIKIQGTESTADLTFTNVSDGVLIEAGQLDILIQNQNAAQMNDADNFLFG